MAAPKELIWDREPHTAAKHDLLRQYLQAWFPILLQGGFPGLTYAEGFAGPGEYTHGEPGSPIIALEQVLDRPELLGLGIPVRFAFVEERADRYQHLRDLIQTRWPRERRPQHITMQGKQGTCEQELIPLLTAVGAWGDPIFANLDAWGVDVPWRVVKRLADNRSSEVLVTFTSDFFLRFAQIESSTADDMFGSREWREVENVPTPSKRQFLVNEYRESLNRAGFPFTLAFEMVDEGGRALFIIYGSPARRGLEVMKDAMWKVDRVYGVRFRDPKDPDQAALDIEEQPDVAPLRRLVIEHMGDGKRHSVQEIRDFALLGTVYRETHAHGVVRELVQEGRLGRDPSGGRITKQTNVWLA